MMSRTQIALDAELLAAARERARQLGVSLAEYIRRLVARDLREHQRAPVDPSAVFDLGTAQGGSDIASRKDAYLGEAIVADRERRRR